MYTYIILYYIYYVYIYITYIYITSNFICIFKYIAELVWPPP